MYLRGDTPGGRSAFIIWGTICCLGEPKPGQFQSRGMSVEREEEEEQCLVSLNNILVTSKLSLPSPGSSS